MAFKRYGYCDKCNKKRYVVNAVVYKGVIYGFCSNCTRDVVMDIKKTTERRKKGK